MITVKELTDKLQEYPDDTTVMCFKEGEGEYNIEQVKPCASVRTHREYVCGLLLEEL
ncbi:hypothetical protein [uncultured Methanobrevibacter sp.]|uniref:hypothetical protein n=1 Tax=uncultured Methanobrevibacter sp. TaxID=253161 RepID=UPI00262A9C7A|nr:hypothetical protein [uncultured Methanobrevibacter sp.]